MLGGFSRELGDWQHAAGLELRQQRSVAWVVGKLGRMPPNLARFTSGGPLRRVWMMTLGVLYFFEVAPTKLMTLLVRIIL